MHIVCFLHSHAETGDYLGFEGMQDIFEMEGFRLELVDSDLNILIGDLISQHIWNKVKDSMFKIEFNYDDDEGLNIIKIDQFNVIFPRMTD